MEFIPEKYLVTAGGRITCLRCKAFLKKHHRQCLSPAINKKTSLCKWHGGASSGPRTQEGIERIRKAHLKTGNETMAAKEQRSKQSANLQMLEDAMHLLGMTTAKRSRGRKATGYTKIRSLKEIKV
jgi:hypothetical protein